MNNPQPSTFNLPPAVGDQVFFRLDHGPNIGDWRPAVVVRTWGASAGGINLLVFTDAINDDHEKVYWAVSRIEGQENGDWSRTPGYAPAATPPETRNPQPATTTVTLADETPAPFGALAEHLATGEAQASVRLDGQTLSADESRTSAPEGRPSEAPEQRIANSEAPEQRTPAPEGRPSEAPENRTPAEAPAPGMPSPEAGENATTTEIVPNPEPTNQPPAQQDSQITTPPANSEQQTPNSDFRTTP